MNTTIERSAKAANAIGGKTARACENCLVKRARWFCTADNAFLCQACDSSVHSANQLASKHERFRLGTSSYKIDHHHNPSSSSSSSPCWHQGFTKKARTPRFRSLQPSISNNPNTDPIVPEINSIEEWRHFHPYNDQNEEQSVPVFPPSFEDDFDCVKLLGTEEGFLGDDDHCLDIGDVDFSVGNMLEEDNASCGISRLVDLGLEIRSSAVNKAKEEEEDEDSDEEVQAAIASCHVDDNPQLDIEFDWDFDDYNSTKQTKGEGIKSESDILDEATRVPYDHGNNSVSNNMKLKLNYEAVMESWESQDNSPWIDGVRPRHFSIDDFTVSSMRGIVGLRWGAEREARVMRYKEKRRTRLFSKKIRYQVRKLNAQKRPRIKGRFVKRSSMVAMSAFSGISFP